MGKGESYFQRSHNNVPREHLRNNREVLSQSYLLSNTAPNNDQVMKPLLSFASKMAEVPRNRLPSFYDEDFVYAVEEDFKSSIGHLPLKEPVQTRCGKEHFTRCGQYSIKRI